MQQDKYLAYADAAVTLVRSMTAIEEALEHRGKALMAGLEVNANSIGYTKVTWNVPNHRQNMNVGNRIFREFRKCKYCNEYSRCYEIRESTNGRL
jgi:hypothetical protein